MPIAEFYGYSLAGLVARRSRLILAGIRLPDKALRLAGLVLLTATIVKVFLVDAAGARRACCASSPSSSSASP